MCQRCWALRSLISPTHLLNSKSPLPQSLVFALHPLSYLYRASFTRHKPRPWQTDLMFVLPVDHHLHAAAISVCTSGLSMKNSSRSNVNNARLHLAMSVPSIAISELCIWKGGTLHVIAAARLLLNGLLCSSIVGRCMRVQGPIRVRPADFGSISNYICRNIFRRCMKSRGLINVWFAMLASDRDRLWTGTHGKFMAFLLRSDFLGLAAPKGSDRL